MDGSQVAENEGSFVDLLVQLEDVDPKRIQQLAHQAEESHSSLILSLYHNHVLDPLTLALSVARYYGLPYFDLQALDETAIPHTWLYSELVHKYQGLPLYQDERALWLAVMDPTLPQIDELRFMSGLTIKLVIATELHVREWVERILGSKLTSGLEDLSDYDVDNLEVNIVEEQPEEEVATYDVNDQPVVRFVNKILLDAIHSRASDIHFEPYESLSRVRYRKDGLLTEVATPPIQFANSIVARLKVMANLDISERRIPQDGRFKLTIARGRSIDFRMSTCPTLHGEKVVMRLLDPATAALEVSALGMTPPQQAIYLEAIKSSQGMILVTGPTGSGKTITLYSAIRLLNTPEKNISTIEDPVEIYMAGINQVQVHNKIGLTFSNTLRAFLRQDPDIMMVGEIRDIETVEIAIKAAQTGHLVFSTLHTNSAAETLSRLSSMGVKSFNIASSVRLIIAQRLVRQLCEHCKTPLSLPEEQLVKAGFDPEIVSSLELYQATSCRRCTNGYKGRLGIFEVLPIDAEIERRILESANAYAINQLAREQGYISLRQSGLDKVRLGLTTLEEVNRVITI